MHTSYHRGVDQFKALIDRLSSNSRNKKGCGSLPSYQAKSEQQVVNVLLSARQDLLDLGVQLLVADEAVKASSTQTDICRAYDHYRAAHPFIRSL